MCSSIASFSISRFPNLRMGKRGSAVASRKRSASSLVSIPGALCAEDVEVSLPPLSELQAITDNVEFRKRAVDLGLAIRLRKSDGSGWASAH